MLGGHPCQFKWICRALHPTRHTHIVGFRCAGIQGQVAASHANAVNPMPRLCAPKRRPGVDGGDVRVIAPNTDRQMDRWQASLRNAQVHNVTLAQALQPTCLIRGSIIFVPSIQLEYELPYRSESSTAWLRTVAFCSPFALAMWVTPVASAQTAASNTKNAGAMPAHRVVIDPATSRVRMVEPSEMPPGPSAASAALPNAPGQAASKAAVSGIETHPAMKRMRSTASEARMGAGARRFDTSSLQFSVIRRDADGKLSTECVHGDEAAHNAVHSEGSGARHDH